MITSFELYNIFKKYELTFFTGIPDSTFADWMLFLAEHDEKLLTNIIACNECESIAICVGYYLASGKIGVAYMQNAGFGKTINPLTSLCNPELYSIPVLLMIGWRGEPGKLDEPQHKKMGRIMNLLLKDLEIPYVILPFDIGGIEREIKKAKNYLETNKAPYALIIKKGIINNKKSKENLLLNYEMTREMALKLIIDKFDQNEIIISTTGKTSRELYEYRDNHNEVHRKDFYMVGSMGCAASIGLGIALQKKGRRVIVIDGDGALIMQMGALATIGHKSPPNLIHIVFDNESHDSTGGQPTVSKSLNFKEIALNCNYKYSALIKSKSQLISELNNVKKLDGPSMLVIKVKQGSRKDLGRPKTSFIKLKNGFIRYLEDND